MSMVGLFCLNLFQTKKFYHKCDGSKGKLCEAFNTDIFPNTNAK